VSVKKKKMNLRKKKNKKEVSFRICSLKCLAVMGRRLKVMNKVRRGEEIPKETF